MQYQKIHPAVFRARPNRFVAQVELAGETVTCHVKNTGRCRELLVPGARVYLEESENPGRKTKYDLIAVEKGERLINMDAQAPNQVFGEWARAGKWVPDLTLLRPETKYGASRFDFYWEAPDRRGFVEVKGVTLEEDGVVRFPDAPTLRGGAVDGAQRPHPPGVRRGPPPGRRSRGAGAGPGLRRPAGPAGHRRAGGGAAVKVRETARQPARRLSVLRHMRIRYGEEIITTPAGPVKGSSVG